MSEECAMAEEGRLWVAGCELVATPEGGLYWPARKTLIVADLHMEKGSAFACKGLMLPPYDTPSTLAVIDALMGRYRPQRVIALGDSFHREDGHLGLTGDARALIAGLTGKTDWIWIAGNHDPAPPLGLGGSARAEISIDGLSFRHGPRAGSGAGAGAGEIAGHLHPVARLRSRGRVIRRRCFASDGQRLVMPAMGAYAGGLNVLDAAFAGLFPPRRFHAWMLGSDRVYPLRASRLIPDPGVVQQRRAGAA